MNWTGCIAAGVISQIPGSSSIGVPQYNGLSGYTSAVATTTSAVSKYGKTAAANFTGLENGINAATDIAEKAEPWMWTLTAVNAGASIYQCLSGQSPHP
jgi:hypothetical protein